MAGTGDPEAVHLGHLAAMDSSANRAGTMDPNATGHTDAMEDFDPLHNQDTEDSDATESVLSDSESMASDDVLSDLESTTSSRRPSTSTASDSPLLRLPSEMIEHIARTLWTAPRDAGSYNHAEGNVLEKHPDPRLDLRYVCRQIRDATRHVFAHMFVRSATVAFTGSSLIHLNTLASHPEVSQSIRLLRIDPRRLSRPSRLARQFTTLHCALKEKWSRPLPSAAGQEEHAVMDYLDAYDEQQAFDASAFDVELLASALRKLSKLEQIILEPWADQIRCYEPEFRVAATEGNTWNGRVKESRQTCVTRALCKLSAALDIANAPGTIHQFKAILSPGGVFDVGATDVDKFQPSKGLGRALSHVKDLQLHIALYPWAERPESQGGTRAKQVLRTLTASPSIESLVVDLEVVEPVPHLSSRKYAERTICAVLLHREPWENLRVFTLRGWSELSCEHIAMFIASHASTLERIELVCAKTFVTQRDVDQRGWQSICNALSRCSRLRKLRLKIAVGIEEFVLDADEMIAQEMLKKMGGERT